MSCPRIFGLLLLHNIISTTLAFLTPHPHLALPYVCLRPVQLGR